MRPLVLITCAGRGIGAAAAQRCAAAGWAVAVNYARDGAAAQAVVDAIVAGGGEARAFAADVADDAQVVALFAAVDAAFGPGRLRGLVNNAGIVAPAARVDAYDPARVRRLFEVNVFGSLACAREALRRLSTAHGGAGGAIVNLSSVAARLGGPGEYVDYAASKGAIESFTIGLAKEVAAEGVRVNAVRPGIIATEIHASGGRPERASQMAGLIPMQRPGTADEVARSIVWLLSDEASYVTGAIVDVGGGR
ncbi:MAG TPA: SDR family oxidoreductase [Methylibium sp.]|nr:SDR family oxidoreductase [Methylibium sp.]